MYSERVNPNFGVSINRYLPGQKLGLGTGAGAVTTAPSSLKPILRNRFLMKLNKAMPLQHYKEGASANIAASGVALSARVTWTTAGGLKATGQIGIGPRPST